MASSYTRYIINPRSFYKVWLSHVDAYPLFVANAAGVGLVTYFLYRKLVKHPDVKLTTCSSFLDPITDGSFDEGSIKKIDDWRVWLDSFLRAKTNMADLFPFYQLWGESLGKYENAWDRTDVVDIPSRATKVEHPRIASSFYQEMIALKKVTEAEDIAVDEYFFVADETASKLPLVTKESIVSLAGNVGIMEAQLKILAEETGHFKPSAKSITDYCSKLRSIKKESDVSDEMVNDLNSRLLDSYNRLTA